MNLQLQDIKGKVIFLSPLDWGLGHATRCLPIIEILSEHNKVILGVSELNAAFFDFHCPVLQKILMPSYGVRYSKRLPLFLKLILQIPRLLRIVRKEKTLLDHILSQNKIDLVISDSRFGCRSARVKSIFVTHQLHLQTPFFLSLAKVVNRRFINAFDEVWVPDFYETEERLSGNLSKALKIKKPIHFIGPMSALGKFAKTELANTNTILILLSGVEPQRTVLEENLLKALKGSDKKIILVRGSQAKMKKVFPGIEVHDFFYGEMLAGLINRAGTVICRSGYSTLMDMKALNKKSLILIPTPGQTEQEYLAEHWSQKFNAKICLQQEVEKLRI